MAFYKYVLISPYRDDNTTISEIAGIQTALVLLPLVYLVSYTVYHIVKRIKGACQCKTTIQAVEEIENSNEVIDNLETRDFASMSREMNDYRLLSPEPEVMK